MTQIVMRGGEKFHTPEPIEDVLKRFRRNWTCPATAADGKTTWLVWNHVLYVDPK